MTYEPGVYLVEKRIIIPGERLKPRDRGEVVTDRGAAKPKKQHHIPQKALPLEERVKPGTKQSVLFIEEKDRSGRGYSTTYDTKGVPIVKLRYCRFEPKYPPTDGREQRFASFDVVMKGSVSFVYFNGNFVQSSFELTEPGYENVKDFLLRRPNGRTHRRRGGPKGRRSRDIIGEFNGGSYFLKYDRKILVIQAEIDQLQFDALEWVEQKKVGRETIRKKSLKPKNTTQDFNGYVYELLLQTYERFEKPFLGQ